jgi:hypothetical protein
MADEKTNLTKLELIAGGGSTVVASSTDILRMVAAVRAAKRVRDTFWIGNSDERALALDALRSALKGLE